MRTLTISLAIALLATGCAASGADIPSGYPSYPSAPQASDQNPAASRVVDRGVAADVRAAPRGEHEPRTLEPRFAAREIAPRAPTPRRGDFVECWQCR